MLSPGSDGMAEGMIMGMMINGHWHDHDEENVGGTYTRSASLFAGDLTGDEASALRGSPGRFHLVASLSCPWSHRTTLVHALKGLSTAVPVITAGGPRTQGYAVNGRQPTHIPGCPHDIVHVHELYRLTDPAYTGRVTVPVLWDSAGGRIVSNASADIMRAFDRAGPAPGSCDFTLAPEPLRSQIDALNDDLYTNLNNGVYRAGFATAQSSYEEAVHQVFDACDRLEARLSHSRYLFDNTLTEADLRLLPTLVRFDAVYSILFKCSLRRLIDYDALWAYARDLYGWAGVAATVDFETMRRQSYLNDQDTPHPLIAVMPDTDWTAPHDRDRFGPARLALTDGSERQVDPRTLELL